MGANIQFDYGQIASGLALFSLFIAGMKAKRWYQTKLRTRQRISRALRVSAMYQGADNV